jgi:hypothetical protein
MNRARYRRLKVGAIPVMILAGGFYLAGVSYGQHSHTMPRRAPQPTRQAQPSSPQPKAEVSLRAIHAQQVPALQEAVGRAIQHLQEGHQQEALTEMQRVKASLETLRQALGKHVGPMFLNDRCPIMGAKIDPEKVPAELTRVYGQGKVAFCCAGCPAQWARLTAAEKAVKLKEIAVAPPQTLPGTPPQP